MYSILNTIFKTIRSYYVLHVSATHIAKQKYCRQIILIVYVCIDITRYVLTTNVIDLSLSQATTIQN